MIPETINPLGVCFGLMKIKYQTYDNILADINYIEPTDKINVFLNLETVLKYISMTQDLEKKVMTCRGIGAFLVSDIINLAAHYKDFFKGNGLDTKIFLYLTDLSSEIDDFQESKFEEDFRSYYLTKYMNNPRYVLLGNKLNDVVFPEVRKICEYIPDVYFISEKGIDSGLIPSIISAAYPDRKNVVMSGDIHDTQYGFEPGFISHFYLRGFNTNIMASNTVQYLRAITKQDTIPKEIVETFKNPSFYKLLLSCMGDRYRSIMGIRGIKMAKLIAQLRSAVERNAITGDTSNAALLADTFPDEFREDVYHHMMAIDIRNRIKMLGEGTPKKIVSQIVDKSDITSLMKLNETSFQRQPLWLEALLR